MNEHDQKPEWQTRKWWVELFGMYRDERIDDLTRHATRWGYNSTLILGGFSGAFLMILGDWHGAVMLGMCLISLGLLSYSRYSIEPHIDEFATYQFNRLFLYHLGAIYGISLIFYLAVVIQGEFAPDPRFWAWTAMIILPSFITSGYLIYRGAFPIRTVLMLTLIIVISTGFGYLSAAGTIPRWVFIGVMGSLIPISIWIHKYGTDKRPW